VRRGAVIFELSHQMFETRGERRRKIVLRSEHSSDRCSDDAIAGVRRLERCGWLATHNILLELAFPAPAVSPHRAHTSATGVLSLRSAKPGLGPRNSQVGSIFI
jgi:hypothetical protein